MDLKQSNCSLRWKWCVGVDRDASTGGRHHCSVIPWSGRRISRGDHPHYISRLQFAVCRSYDLIGERVWTITFFPHSFVSFRSRDHVCVFHECHTFPLLNMGIVTPKEVRPALPEHGISTSTPDLMISRRRQGYGSNTRGRLSAVTASHIRF